MGSNGVLATGPTTALIYTRLSTDEQAREGQSLAAARKAGAGSGE